MHAVTDRLDRPHLVGRRLDGWLTGWIAVALWVVAWIGSRTGHPLGSLGIPYYWPAAVLSTTHFAMTYRLGYTEGGAAVRRHPFALVVGPALMGAALGGIVVVAVIGGAQRTRDATEIAILAVFLLTTWHYVKQVYGVARIGAKYRGIRLTANETKVLRFGLYPLWLLGASQVLMHGAGTRYAGFGIGLEILPSWTDEVARFVGTGTAAAIAIVMFAAARRANVLPPPLMIAPYAAAVLWLAFPTDIFGSFLALGALHGLQYLACCYRAEVARGLQRISRRTALRWLEVFGGAACGGLLLSVWTPQLVDRTVAVADAPLLFTAVLFVFLNLHHYLIDAVIWRSGGDLVRSMADTPTTASTPTPVVLTA